MQKITKRKNGSMRLQTFTPGASMTKKSEAAACNINTIMEKFVKTGQILPVNMKTPSYGDYSNVPDYKESLETVIAAEAQFKKLDPSLRTRFQNSPEKFLAFVNDKTNIKEMQKLGLVKPDKEIKKTDIDVPVKKPQTSIKATNEELVKNLEKGLETLKQGLEEPAVDSPSGK